MPEPDILFRLGKRLPIFMFSAVPVDAKKSVTHHFELSRCNSVDVGWAVCAEADRGSTFVLDEPVKNAYDSRVSSHVYSDLAIRPWFSMSPHILRTTNSIEHRIH